MFRLENKSKIASILKGTAVFTINDDGKNVSASKSFSVYPFDAMVGIRANDTYIDANSKLTLNFVSVDPLKDEELKDRQKAIEIKKEIWDYNYDKDGYLRWHSRYEKVFSDTLSGNEFVYDFKQSGDYVVTVSDILSGHSANLNVYVSGWDYGGTLQPTKELAKAKIKLNQKVYKKGDSLNVDVSSVLKSGIGIVTVESEKNLNLKVGKKVVFIFKAPSVMLAKEENLKLSAANSLKGRVIEAKIGSVNAEIVLEISNHQTLTSIITKESAMQMRIGVGDELTAIIKASQIIIGV